MFLSIHFYSQLDGCLVWNAHNTVFGSKRSVAVYFLHSTRPSITWPNSRSSLPACDWLMSALSAVPSTGVRRRRKFGGGFLYGVYRPGEWLWIDSNGKMETTLWVKKGCHPTHGYNFANSWSICKILSLLHRAVNFQQNRLPTTP